MNDLNIKDVQAKILETMVFIDRLCREHEIEYYIMGGTAIGAVRHGGFIPWDDDLDIFMTPGNYKKFKKVFNEVNDEEFVLQEWGVVKGFLEYSKVRMNGTTFIEKAFKDQKDMHHGIYVDIMILHKCPNKKYLQKIIYFASKYVTLLGLSNRNWIPKNKTQKLALNFIKMLPNDFLAKNCYKLIYKYENLKNDYSYYYFITKANFNQGVFDRRLFEKPKDIRFEGYNFLGPTYINEYLDLRYGDYMTLPSKKEQEAAVHAEIYDTKVGYEYYL